MTQQTWPTPWVKGFLELAVLAVIGRAETYGYELSRELTDAGFGEVKGGTLYPILGRLEEAGLVTTTWRTGEHGPGRKYYAITEKGTAELSLRALNWDRFSAAVTDLVKEQS